MKDMIIIVTKQLQYWPQIGFELYIMLLVSRLKLLIRNWKMFMLPPPSHPQLNDHTHPIKHEYNFFIQFGMVYYCTYLTLYKVVFWRGYKGRQSCAEIYPDFLLVTFIVLCSKGRIHDYCIKPFCPLITL